MCYYPSPLDQQGLSSLSLSAFCLNRWDWGTKGKKGSLFSLTLPVHKHKPEHRGPTEQDCFHSTHIHWDHMYPHTKADRRPMSSQLLGIYQRWLLTNYLKFFFFYKSPHRYFLFFFSHPILKITFLHQCGVEVVLKERLSLSSLTPELRAFVLSWSDVSYVKRFQAEPARLRKRFMQLNLLAWEKAASWGKGAQKPAVIHDGLPVHWEYCMNSVATVDCNTSKLGSSISLKALAYFCIIY